MPRRGYIRLTGKDGAKINGSSSIKGLTPIRPSRPVYGYNMHCTCGWISRGHANQHKPEAESIAKQHLRIDHGGVER